jgi:hypothetical protein
MALWHQLVVLQRSAKKARIWRTDQILWVLLLRVWSDWRESLAIVEPETFVEADLGSGGEPRDPWRRRRMGFMEAT